MPPLDLAAAATGIAAKLALLQRPAPPVLWFPQTAPAAQPFLAALIARHTRRRAWLICPTPRAQEDTLADIAPWHPAPLNFPDIETPVPGALPDPDLHAERLAILRQLAQPDPHGAPPPLVILTQRALDNDTVPHPATWARREIPLAPGHTLDRPALLDRLDAIGYTDAPIVTERRQYATRGGILDIFCPHHTNPLRIELFGDEIESLREFDIHTQTTLRRLDHATLLIDEETSPAHNPAPAPLRHYLRPGDLLIALDAPPGATAHIHITSQPLAPHSDNDDDTSETDPAATDPVPFHDHHATPFAPGELALSQAKRNELHTRLHRWRRDNWHIEIHSQTQGEQDRLREILATGHPSPAPVHHTLSPLRHGFTSPPARLALLAAAELLGRHTSHSARRAAAQKLRPPPPAPPLNFADLTPGDHIVHADHGIARYLGLDTHHLPGQPPQETLLLEFAGGAKLYLPLEHAHHISRYIGLGNRPPQLSQLGHDKWAKTKKTAEKAIQHYAGALLAIQAQRQSLPGHPFPPDTPWMREFEDSFPHQETPGQLQAIADTKADMESTQPMDRLICGDVGYGKTEVAIRAAFKAATSGKQVALLAPTTILAQQHHHTLAQRMSDYPLNIALLTRHTPPAEQTDTIRRLATGEIDILIGTHRILTPHIHFKDLGLAIIDEEHRFGVRHKEHLKQTHPLIDILTLTATPIPRTLHMALTGARPMTAIETAPPGRHPIETTIAPHDDRVIRQAIQRELSRQGQIYYLHNHIAALEPLRRRLQTLVPALRIGTAHSQMDQDDIERTMAQFTDGQIDLLLCTTIIENGLDIPNANTIIIDRPDRIGLADLHQLRGRVGRSHHRAHALLLLPPDQLLGGDAKKRLSAIREHNTLGSGHRIAMRDLQIRGAGNLLGTQQSGQITAIGFDMYCKLLRKAIEQATHNTPPPPPIHLHIDFATLNEAQAQADLDTSDKAPAYLPAHHIPPPEQRIEAYRRLAEATTPRHLDALDAEWTDRYGPHPRPVANLLLLHRIRLAAQRKKFQSLEIRDGKLMARRHGEYLHINGKFPRLKETHPDRRLQETLRLIEQ